MNTQCSHYGAGGLTRLCLPLYHSLDYREKKRQFGEEGKRGPQMWSQMKGEGEPVADGRPQSPRCGRWGGDLLRGTQEPGAAEPQSPLTEDHAGDPGARGSASLCPGGRSGRAGGTGGGVGGGAEAGRGGAGAEPAAGEDGRRGDPGTQGSKRGRPGGSLFPPAFSSTCCLGLLDLRCHCSQGWGNKASRGRCVLTQEAGN